MPTFRLIINRIGRLIINRSPIEVNFKNRTFNVTDKIIVEQTHEDRQHLQYALCAV